MSKNTKNVRAEIPGFGRYQLDLFTQEIVSKNSNIIKTRVDDRGKNPVTVVTLCKNNGIRSTVKYVDLVKKTLESLVFTTVTASNTSNVLLSYYNKITPEFLELSVLDMSKEVSQDLPNVELIIIGRILQKIRSSGKHR